MATGTSGNSEHRGEPSGLRDRKKARTRAAIVEAAMSLFADRGYDETTVEDVAAAADVSPATVFRYFGSKEDLVFTEGRSVPLIASAIAERPGSESDMEAAEAGLRSVLTSGQFGIDRLRLQRRAIEKSVVLRGRGSTMLRAWRGAIAEGLAKRHGSPTGDPGIELRAAVLMTALELSIAEWVDDQAEDLSSALAAVFGRLGHLAAEWSPPGGTGRRRAPAPVTRGRRKLSPSADRPGSNAPSSRR